MSVRILAVGDVCGEPGLAFLENRLKNFKKENNIDFTVVNGENANVVGITPRQADAIFRAGADVITLGNHTWTRTELQPYLEERRKILRRSTTAPMPTPKGLLAAWNVRKESKEAMIRLGGMLHDLACYVDSSLRIDGNGDVVGRNGGIRGWLRENLPELAGKYKTLMRYKAMAIRLRQATQTMDPTPTAKLLKHPQPEIVKALLKDVRTTFSSLEAGISFYISPATIFAEKSSLFRSKKRLRRVGKDIRKRFLKKVV